MIYRKLTLAFAIVAIVSGCASVPLASVEKDKEAKSFTVASGKSNIYVYRNESMGGGVKMPVLLDGRAVGDTAAKTYLAIPVEPGKHTLISKTENDASLELATEADKNYFVWQEVKMGLVSARSALHAVSEEQGKKGVGECKLVAPQ